MSSQRSPEQSRICFAEVWCYWHIGQRGDLVAFRHFRWTLARRERPMKPFVNRIGEKPQEISFGNNFETFGKQDRRRTTKAIYSTLLETSVKIVKKKRFK